VKVADRLYFLKKYVRFDQFRSIKRKGKSERRKGGKAERRKGGKTSNVIPESNVRLLGVGV
jgi:hypothetical protein